MKHLLLMVAAVLAAGWTQASAWCPVARAAGSFWMGGGPSSGKVRNGGIPRHRVTLSRPFYLGKTEVTQEQWIKVTPNPLPPGGIRPSSHAHLRHHLHRFTLDVPRSRLRVKRRRSLAPASGLTPSVLAADGGFGSLRAGGEA